MLRNMIWREPILKSRQETSQQVSYGMNKEQCEEQSDLCSVVDK